MEALIARSVQILIALGGAYILTLWFAIVVWTFQDIQARSRSVVAQIFSTLVVLIFSIPGLLIYLILRPRYTLDDAFQRSLEEEYLMQDLEELPLCPGCQQYVEDDWVFCPNCRTELRDNCIACDQLIDLRWDICPFCGTEQYEDEDAPLPEPVIQPVMAPSPQFLGRPQMTQTDVFRLQESEQHTRPIIPATVRVDLRSGDVLKEAVPELPISTPINSLGGPGELRRVTLAENGDKPVADSSEAMTPDPVDTPDAVADDGADSPDVTSDILADGAASSDADGDESVLEDSTPAQAATSADEVTETDSVIADDSVAQDQETAPDKPENETGTKTKKRRKRRRKPRETDADS